MKTPTAVSRAARKDQGAPTILLVDDSPDVLRSVERRLSRRTRVVTAVDFESAMAVLEIERVDLVITDHSMPPGRNGLDLLGVVRERWPSARRVLMSGDRVVGVEEALDGGILDRFLMKPLEVADLLALVDALT